MIIAVDGPSASGKSTVAKLVAKELNLDYIDTGAMYRIVTLAYLRAKNKIKMPGREDKAFIDYDLLELVLRNIEIKFQDGKIFLKGEDVSDLIRSQEVSVNVSDIAAIKSVRDKLTEEQREMGANGNVIMDGRDVGTTVFPNADLKVFLVASAEVRAKRRLKDYCDQGEKIELHELIEEIKKRDRKDSERKESPLKKADDAIEINTDNMSIEEVTQRIVSLQKNGKV